eukprot:6490446-Amphidinium_carterae.1
MMWRLMCEVGEALAMYCAWWWTVLRCEVWCVELLSNAFHLTLDDEYWNRMLAGVVGGGGVVVGDGVVGGSADWLWSWC